MHACLGASDQVSKCVFTGFSGIEHLHSGSITSAQPCIVGLGQSLQQSKKTRTFIIWGVTHPGFVPQSHGNGILRNNSLTSGGVRSHQHGIASLQRVDCYALERINLEWKGVCRSGSRLRRRH